MIIKLFIFFQLFLYSAAFKNDFTINITLNTDHNFNKGFLYKEIILLPYSETILEINYELDIKKSIENYNYGIIQVHSFLYDITLSYEKNIKNANHLNGTNLGLTIFSVGTKTNLYVLNSNNIKVNAAIIAILYEKYVPIPGGCDTTLINPSLKIHYDHDMIEVITTEASKSINQSLCDRNYKEIQYQPHYLYLKKNDLNPETYFAGIKKMVNIKNIKEHGITARLSVPESNFRTVYIATPGTGIVFNTIIKDSNGHVAAYVPAVSYSCNPIFWQNDCKLFLNTNTGIIISTFLVIAGFIQAFITCENADFDIFYNCLPLWAYAIFKLLSNFPKILDNTRTIIITVSSVFFTILTCVFARCIGISKIIAIITRIVIGFIFGVFIMFYLGQFTFFAQDSVYWTCFIAILSVFMLFIIWIRRVFSFILSTFLGVTTILFGIQIYFQSHMLLIPLAHFRRMLNINYKYANGFWTPNATDYGVFILTTVLFALGITCRKYRILSYDNEVNEQNNTRDDSGPLITRWTEDSDDVFETPNTNYRFFRKLSSIRKKRQRNSVFY